MWVEVTFTGLYQKTERTCNGWVPDKMDSKWRETIDVSPVQSVTGFVYVQNVPVDLSNVNGRKMDVPNCKRI